MRATVEYLQGRSQKTLRRFLAELRPSAGYAKTMSNEALARAIMALPELRRPGGVRLRMTKGRLSIIDPAPGPKVDVERAAAAAARVRSRIASRGGSAKSYLSVFEDGTFERKVDEVGRAMKGGDE